MSGETSVMGAPTLAEDVLLLLFQPDSGTIAGENILFYVLAGAVLADLALEQQVTITTTSAGTVKVASAEGRAPSDEILRSAWEYVSDKPRGVQTVLAAIGPMLREPLLERLIARGDIREESRKAFGLFPTTILRDGGMRRRGALLHSVRTVLVEGADPTPRVAALVGLLWGSATLPQFHPFIPWTSEVIGRAQDLQRGSWGVEATAHAVARTTTAVIVNSVTLPTVLSRT